LRRDRVDINQITSEFGFFGHDSGITKDLRI
jgi:hypothetical protein